MIISIIVAMDKKGGIGKNNQLPWHLPSDLKRFKKITMGHCLVMGRKTFETIGRPLPGRVMIVVTHQKDFSPKETLVANSIEAAIEQVADKQETELFIIGGGDIFNQIIDLADKIYLTTVHANVNADIFFPKIDFGQWKRVSGVDIEKGEADEFESDFRILIREH